jgi:hypothetical protein
MSAAKEHRRTQQAMLGPAVGMVAVRVELDITRGLDLVVVGLLTFELQ